MICKKIHSKILSVTCQSSRTFLPLIHIHLYPFVNFQNSTSYYFLSLSQSSKVECELYKNSLKNFICHLSWFKKLSPTHTHPLISIYEFSKPYKLLFLEFESFIKRLNVNCIKIHSTILSVTCHGLRNFPPLIHIPLYPLMTF